MKSGLLVMVALVSCSESKPVPLNSSGSASTAQDEDSKETAEEVFRKIGKAIDEANTLRVRFDWGGEGRYLPNKECGSRRGGSWGSIVLKASGRFIYEEWGCSGPNEVQTTKISNGERICQASTVHQPDGTKRKSRSEEKLERNTPKDLVENLRLVFLRVGSVGINWVLSGVMESPETYTPDYRELCRVSDFIKGVDGKGGAFVKYKLSTKSPEGRQFSDSIVVLWYESKTYRLLKRAQYPNADYGKKDAIVWFDDYKEFAINEDFPDSRFTLPNEH